MSDPANSPANSDWQAIETRMRERNRRIQEATVLNKATLFDALNANGVTLVTVRFDGYGDSGQIEEIVAQAADTVVTLPETTVPIARPRHDLSGLDHSDLSLREAVETLSYDFLEETHGCWQDNEGSFGDFTYDVAARTITLDCNVRVTRTDYYEHSF